MWRFTCIYAEVSVTAKYQFYVLHTDSVLFPLQWHHNGYDGVSNHQHREWILSRLFGCRSKKTSKLRVTGLCAGNSPATGEFPAQIASNAENVSIWWRPQGLFFDKLTAGTLLTTWFNLIIPLISNGTHYNVREWNHLSIPKVQRYSRWSLGLDKY